MGTYSNGWEYERVYLVGSISGLKYPQLHRTFIITKYEGLAYLMDKTKLVAIDIVLKGYY